MQYMCKSYDMSQIEIVDFSRGLELQQGKENIDEDEENDDGEIEIRVICAVGFFIYFWQYSTSSTSIHPKFNVEMQILFADA